jgi:hypothetical protein
MLPPSIVCPSQKNTYLNDNTRNLRLNLNDNRVNDYGRNTYTNFMTDKAELQELEGEQSLNVHRSGFGYYLPQQDLVETTNKDTMLYNYNGQLSIQNPHIGEYASGITDYDAKTTNKQMYIDNKYLASPFKNKAAGYLNTKYNANTTLKQETTERLSKDYRVGGRTRVQENAGKSNMHIKNKYNKLFTENLDYRSKFHTNNSQVIPMKVNMGGVADKNNDLSRIPNQRIQQTDLISSQLNKNPFVLQGTAMYVDPFIQNM